MPRDMVSASTHTAQPGYKYAQQQQSVAAASCQKAIGRLLSPDNQELQELLAAIAATPKSAAGKVGGQEDAESMFVQLASQVCAGIMGPVPAHGHGAMSACPKLHAVICICRLLLHASHLYNAS